nr:uncharacterized protein LOC109174778 [Ipomoea batatas]
MPHTRCKLSVHIRAKYRDIPQDLKDLLSTFLERCGEAVRAATVRNLKPRRMKMSWHDATNKEDCAIYAMRNMQSFMGQGCKRWDCGLEKGNHEQLRNLRQIYMSDIMMTDISMHKESIATHTAAYNNKMMGSSHK